MSEAFTGKLFIGGQWRAASGPAFISSSPAAGSIVWRGAEASADDVDASVAAARTALPAWKRTPLAERIALVKRFAALVDQNKAMLAKLIAHETGKAVWDATTEVAAMVGKADLSVRAHTERTPTREAPAGQFTARISHHPHGVMAVLGPFNFPGHLPNGHIMPALIAGNTIVFKPSEHAPAFAEATVKLWEQAGAPTGVINLLQGARGPAERLVTHDGVSGVLFTGGVPAGIAIHRALAGRPDKILALELGGNNPLVVWDAGDLDAAAKLIVKSAYISSGQRCTCARRLIVPASGEGDAILDALQRLMSRLIIGNPDADPQPFYGSLISEIAAEHVLTEQKRLIDAGGKSLVAMRPLEIGPAYLSPGLIDVTSIKDRRDEEIFGPLLQVIRVADFDAALAEANNTRFGLSAGLISDDPKLFEQFEAEVRAGVLNWNRQTTGASGAAPFGGVGFSGNHRPAGYYAADYAGWPMASLIAPGAVADAEPIVGLKP